MLVSAKAKLYALILTIVPPGLTGNFLIIAYTDKFNNIHAKNVPCLTHTSTKLVFQDIFKKDLIKNINKNG